MIEDVGSCAYRFEITLDIANIPTARAARVLAWFVYHIFNKTLSIKYPAVNYLETLYFGAFLEDIDRGWRHGAR